MHILESRIGYIFKDKNILTEALTHPSASKTLAAGRRNYQRLEFLGDGVLGLLISHMIYELYPNEIEGNLSKRRAALVNGATLAEIAREVGLVEALILSPSEEAAGGRGNPAILEDACEALIAALYLDGGMQAAANFVHRLWGERAAAAKEAPRDAKTSLQEWAQGRGKPLPVYDVVKVDGPSHAPEFTITVKVEGCEPVQAVGASKAKAAQKAAQLLLQQLEGDAS